MQRYTVKIDFEYKITKRPITTFREFSPEIPCHIKSYVQSIVIKLSKEHADFKLIGWTVSYA